MNADQDKKYVAFLDILGFSKLIENNSHEDLKLLYEEIFLDEIINTSARQTSDNFPQANLDIQVNSFSDSVIICTPGNTMRDFIVLVSFIRNLVGRSIL